MNVYVGFNLTAAVVLLCSALWLLRRTGLSWRRIAMLGLLMVSAFFVGSRLLYGILYVERILAAPEKLFELHLVNFSLYGGLILCALVWIWFVRRNRLRLWAMTDQLVIPLGIAVAISKLGCFFNGCCYGIATSLPWGVVFDRADQTPASRLFGGGQLTRFITGAVSVHRHPTQLYEVLFALAASGIAAWFIWKGRQGRQGKQGKQVKRQIDGIPALLFVLTLTSGRLLSFMLRDFPNATPASNFVRGPVTYGIIIIFCSYMLYFLMKRGAEPKQASDDEFSDKER